MTRSRTSWSIWLLALLAGPAIAAPASAQSSTQGGKYALLVGVRQYNKNELRTLPYTERDVESLAEVLVQAGYSKDNVVLMTQKAGAADTDMLPTGGNIRTQLKLLLEPRRPGDTVLVAFAGHGVQFVGDEENYFCPADTRLADKKGTLLPLGEVYKALADCKAGFKLLLVDACRNDPQVDASRELAKVKLSSESRPVTTPPGGVAAFYSCSGGQKAFEHDKLKHGVFFHFVIEGLRGKADANRDRQVTLTELQEYVQVHVPDFVRAQYRVLQTPELKGAVRGSVALVSLSHARTALNVLEQAKGLVARREYDKALATYTEAIRLDPKFAAAYEYRARAYAMKKDYDRAIGDLTEAIRLDPKRAYAYALRGDVYRLKKDYDTAIADYDDAARLAPGMPEAYYLRGLAYAGKKDYDRAIRDFTRVLELKPGVALAYSWRGSAHVEKKDYERAIADCSEAIRLQPRGNPAPYLNRGGAFARTGQWQRAVRDYTEAIRIDPRHTQAYRNRGIAHFHLKDYDRAIADYTEALRIEPDNVWTLHERGLCFQNSKDYERAYADYTEAIRLNPRYAPSYNNRGNILVNVKKDYDRAIADYTKAIRLDPKYALAFNNRGLAYALKKDYKRALADYSRAIRLDPNCALAYANRARVYRAMGDRTRAAADEARAKRLKQPQ